MNPALKDYYDHLAPEYDQDRFGNSYGAYIHAQEVAIVNGALGKQLHGQRILDVACGTGRLLQFATDGVDISPEMVIEARKKHPQKKIVVGSATQLPFEDNSFFAVTCFHLLMHLDRATAEIVFRELLRVLRPGGQLIFDVPSQYRRNLVGYKAKGWHGANAYEMSEIKSLFGRLARDLQFEGIAFFPLHRIPKRLRFVFRRLDSWFGRSAFKKYSSYWVCSMYKAWD